ncbi:Metallo-dependent phosphatase-like protein [Blastocladiella britannica]|nr:Metallo-dependent phosphatase-like protein [Blastocladiella britannica]
MAVDLTVFHFNDVYHVSPITPTSGGGAAEFATVLDKERAALPADALSVTLFSGDAFNPSLESSISKGAHMVPVLNALGVEASVFGNHDFDFGIPQLLKLTKETKFPWLIANVRDSAGGLLGQGIEYHVIERGAFRIGLVGLVEREWLDTIVALPPNLKFEDFSSVGQRLARKLKGELGCHLVIALTHMRLPNDEQLARNVPEIDLVLGGHDHDAACVSDADVGGGRKRSGAAVIKSGTDFRELGIVTLNIEDGKVLDVQFRLATIPADTPAKPEVAELRAGIESQLAKKILKPIALSRRELDARSSLVRMEESAVGSWVADVCRWSYDADVALLCGGTIRSDMVFGPGEIKIKDIMELFPFEDPLVVIEITGAQILGALENGVSMWPKQEGRFPQVSGIAFTFDPSLEPGARITESRMTCSRYKDLPIVADHRYKIVTRFYLAEGHDGFTSLLPHTTIVDDEAGMLITTVLRKYCLGLKVIKAMQRVRTVRVPSGLLEEHPHDGPPTAELANEVGALENTKKRAFLAFDCVHTVKGDSRWPKFKKLFDGVRTLGVIDPRIDGRIKRVGAPERAASPAPSVSSASSEFRVDSPTASIGGLNK